ncbi:hypothetical protein J6O86_02995 [bacterium]|nr:hypothetical protein [bacterium]
MENKAFLIDFEALVDIAGTVQINAKNEEEAKRIAKQIIIKNLEIEDCSIELGLENNNDDDVTIREMANPKEINMSEPMQLD